MQIIAECGKNFIDNNWQEENKGTFYYLQNAKKLAREAKKAGADIVKFQTHCFEDEQYKRSKERHEWIKFNEIITPYFEFWKPLKEYCDELGIEFLITSMSKSAAIKINDFVNRWKVSSADIVDMDLLEYLKSTGKPIILSTGMSTKEQIDKAVAFLGDQIQYINYCVSLYPCPIYKIDFEKMVLMKSMYGDKIGFSDHSLNVEIPALAIRAGAKIVEKHFTLDRNAFGPDHKCSLLPDEFKQMVDLCRLAETDGESFEEEKKLWTSFRV
jgi:sialic acid synthase SpsE